MDSILVDCRMLQRVAAVTLMLSARRLPVKGMEHDITTYYVGYPFAKLQRRAALIKRMDYPKLELQAWASSLHLR